MTKILKVTYDGLYKEFNESYKEYSWGAVIDIGAESSNIADRLDEVTDLYNDLSNCQYIIFDYHCWPKCPIEYDNENCEFHVFDPRYLPTAIKTVPTYTIVDRNHRVITEQKITVADQLLRCASSKITIPNINVIKKCEHPELDNDYSTETIFIIDIIE